MEADIRKMMFEKAEQLSVTYYHSNKVGNIMSWFTTDLETIEEFLGWGAIMVADAIFMTIFAAIKMFGCEYCDDAFSEEHAIEVQLPFIQNLNSPQITSAKDFVKEFKKIGHKIKIIPILVGNCDYRLISDLIATYWEDSSFVISSDLSHYYSQSDCRQIDTYTAAIIETGKLESFKSGQACGLTGIMGLVDFADNNDCSMIRIMMYNSGDINHEPDKVVGYGAWFLYPESKNHFLEKYYSFK